ncbi:MAG TPA: glycosyltransferase family 1 protein [Candidatus Baltobacteraceae bacterium]|nr:glycosyltransferase family 1 protein [Candidatus Baltobacteraceae bacterium]
MESPPLVALDARLTRQMSVGMKTYARELAARLPRVAPDLRFNTLRQGANFGWEEQVRLPRAIRKSGANLTHFFSLYTPVLPPRPYIVTIHDLIHLHFPQYFKSKVPLYYRTVVRFAAARAARVITDDERTIEDLERFLGVDPARVRVVPLGVEDRFLQSAEPFRAERPYLLYAGNHREHKDIPTLLRAWALLPPEYAIDLFLTGPDDFGGALQECSISSRRAIALGDVPAGELARYYAGAAALVHPALLEGFGLPLLEAMACGAPVIASARSLPRALEGAALTFAAGDADDAREAILRVLDDSALRERLVQAGRERARTLTWDRCAIQTAEIYRDVLRENALT